MNTKLLMTFSAIILGMIGIVLTFAPQEFASYFSLPRASIIILQISGALYFGFAMINWTARANLIGGIYSKPVAMGNFTHFMIGGLALVKFVSQNTGLVYIWIAVIIYSILAILFGFVSFTNPVLKNKPF
jgi:energy-converting hydrogenase Eha subunit C